MRAKLRAGPIRRLRQVAVTDAYRRYDVTYGSGDLRISGVLLVPHGKGPFPAVVLNHGYIEPSIYVTGQGLAREQDRLARAGFVVLHTDYRGHAGSDPSGPVARETRLGYTRDTINAVAALKRERYVDRDRVAMLGRSMGGGVTLNALVVRPGLVKAAVIFAPVSSSFLDNFDRWTRPERPDAANAFLGRFGGPRKSPDFWSGLSSRTYFDRITEPVLIHHGTSDDSVPDPLVTHHATAAAEGRRREHPADLPGRGARVHPAVAALDGPHDQVPAEADARVSLAPVRSGGHHRCGSRLASGHG